jgi:hypothetical protein
MAKTNYLRRNAAGRWKEASTSGDTQAHHRPKGQDGVSIKNSGSSPHHNDGVTIARKLS